jgi:ribosomal-protein-alanine N-acetyltransferase
MKETPILKTARLTLRPFAFSDVADVYEWCSSLKTTAYVFWYPHKDIHVTERLVQNWVRKKRNYSWAIDAGQGAIGEVQVIKDLPDQGFEIGYILKESAWQKGYMSEAVQAVLHFLFVEQGYRYSLEEVDERNLASRHVLEKMGYRLLEIKEDVLIEKKADIIDVALYRLDKKDYHEIVGR